MRVERYAGHQGALSESEAGSGGVRAAWLQGRGWEVARLGSQRPRPR